MQKNVFFHDLFGVLWGFCWTYPDAVNILEFWKRHWEVLKKCFKKNQILFLFFGFSQNNAKNCIFSWIVCRFLLNSLWKWYLTCGTGIRIKLQWKSIWILVSMGGLGVPPEADLLIIQVIILLQIIYNYWI